MSDELCRSKLNTIQKWGDQENKELRLSTDLPILEPLLNTYDLVLKENEMKMEMMLEDIKELEKSCERHIEEKKKV